MKKTGFFQEMSFKRDRLNQVREDDDDDDDNEKFFFQTLSPTISLREAKRPPRAGGGAIIECRIVERR